eukprot:3182824-Prymnesium_polylepis.2
MLKGLDSTVRSSAQPQEKTHCPASLPQVTSSPHGVIVCGTLIHSDHTRPSSSARQHRIRIGERATGISHRVGIVRGFIQLTTMLVGRASHGRWPTLALPRRADLYGLATTSAV